MRLFWWQKRILHKETLGCGLSFVVREHYECTGAFDRQKSVFTVGVWWWRLAEATANPEADRAQVWLVLRGIHRRALGQRPDFPMNGSVTTELEMQKAWRNEWIQTNLHLHKSASCMSEHRWWVKDWVSSKLEQTRSKRTTCEHFQVKTKNKKNTHFASDSIIVNLISACTSLDKGWASFCLKKQKAWAVGELSTDLHPLIKPKYNCSAVDKQINKKIGEKRKPLI